MKRRATAADSPLEPSGDDEIVDLSRGLSGASSSPPPSKGRKRGRKSDPHVDEPDISRDFAANDSMLENLDMKTDHANRPIWIRDDLTIFLEAFSP